MHLNFDGRCVIVTGAAQGIGRAIAAAFASAGASVHLVDRDADGLAATGRDLALPTHEADLSERSHAHAVVEAVLGQSARLDVPNSDPATNACDAHES